MRQENYFERVRTQFFNDFAVCKTNNEFINHYCDTVRSCIERAGFWDIDPVQIRTTKRTANSYMVLYGEYLVGIVSVIFNGGAIVFDTKMI